MSDDSGFDLAEAVKRVGSTLLEQCLSIEFKFIAYTFMVLLGLYARSLRFRDCISWNSTQRYRSSRRNSNDQKIRYGLGSVNFLQYLDHLFKQYH